MGDKKGEGKGYEIRDRRMFDEDGKLKEDVTATEPAAEGRDGEGAAQERIGGQSIGAEEGAGHGQPRELPPVDFGTLVLSIATSALFHLGEIQEEGKEPPIPDLPLAKHSIDIIGMLAEKTRGNLTQQESKLVEEILFDLRMRFVAKSGRGPQTVN